jgi:hypothetical protein
MMLTTYILTTTLLFYQETDYEDTVDPDDKWNDYEDTVDQDGQ